MKETRLAELRDSDTNGLNSWFDVAWEQAGVITDLLRDVFRPEQIKTSVLAHQKFLIAVEHSLRRGCLSWQKNTAVCHQQRNARKCLWSCLAECRKENCTKDWALRNPTCEGGRWGQTGKYDENHLNQKYQPPHDYWCQRLQIRQAELKQNNHFCLNAQV